ncbi:hypothetical protein B9Z19DRAFT_1121458 [Tuber borchii]|uniref:Uncharacterized protein n=1 Tax=Tuber borchii TaxID=42251 RepID=A0A2T7A2I2_TUBBO|nr:hypothetical protein B9Z19DRAFT_1121458 [Tuber borchii]
MKLSTSLLLLAGASTCVSADHLNKIPKIKEKQVSLKKTEPESHGENLETLIARRVRNVTSENWLSLLQPSRAVAEAKQKEGAAAAEATAAIPTEWYYYFTSSAASWAVCVCWDGIFALIVYALAWNADVNFGKVDCAAEASKDLCRNLYITSTTKIPQFYHLVAYPDKSVEIRKLPRNMDIPFDIQDQVDYYTQFHSSKKWKDIEAWTGVFNPINGTLKDARSYAGIALTAYEDISLWALQFLLLPLQELSIWMVSLGALLAGFLIGMVSRHATEPTRACPQPAPQGAS